MGKKDSLTFSLGLMVFQVFNNQEDFTTTLQMFNFVAN